MRLLTPVFLLWIVALRGHLVLSHSQAPWLESLGYLCHDAAVACLCLLPALLIGSRPRLWRELVASLWLALVTLVYGIAYGSFHKTGSLLDWETLVMVVTHWDDLRLVIGSEVGAIDYLLFGVPILVLLLPLLARLRFRRRAQPAAGKPRRRTLLRAVLYLFIGMGVCLGLGTLLVPSHPRSPQLAIALLRPLVPLGKWAPGAGKVEVERIRYPIEAPDEIHAAWAVRPQDAPKPNFLFVLMESVRASATSPYAPFLDSTPFIAELARGGVVFEGGIVFERAHPHAPHTGKSVHAIFHGYAPEFVTGMTELGRQPAPVAVPARLRQLGYRTAFFDPSTQFFEHRRRLYEELGFSDLVALEDMDQENFQKISYLGLEDRAAIPPILSWLRRNRGHPFCIGFLNLTTHHNYRVPDNHEPIGFEVHEPPPASDAFQDYLNALRYFDNMLRDLFQRLRAEGFLRNTVVFLVGDHGEGFGEHGRHQHADNLWQEAMHVPLIVAGPRSLLGPPRRDPGLRQLMDIAPTVAELVGVPGMRARRSPAVGTSLLATPDNGRTIFLRSHVPNSLLGMIEGTYKTIYHQRFDRLERFDLATDPWERHDVARLLGRRGRAEAIGRMLGFTDSINAWYEAADRRRFQDMWHKKVPPLTHPLDVSFGDRGQIRLLGIDCPQEELTLNHYLRWRLVFTGNGDVPGTQALDLRLRWQRAGKDIRFENVSFLSAVPPSIAKDRVFVLPQCHQFRGRDVEPGPVDLGLELVHPETGKPLPVTGGSRWLLRIRLVP